MDFEEQIKHIKIKRSPEWWLDDIFQKLILYEHKYFHGIFYLTKDKKILFQYDISEKYIIYHDMIHVILTTKYKLKQNDIENLILKNFVKYFKFKDDIFIYEFLKYDWTIFTENVINNQFKLYEFRF